MIPARILAVALVLGLCLPSVRAEELPCRRADPDNPRPRIGLVLGGGGARGIAHVAVLKELERLQVPIDCIAGTSMGSLVGGMYASGMRAEELEAMLLGLDWRQVLKDDIARGERSYRRKQDDLESLSPAKPGVGRQGLRLSSGLVSGQNIQLLLERQIGRSAGIADFDRLPIPFRAVATDINTGRAVVLGEGGLAQAMRASMAIPGVFNPVLRDGRLLVDGGLVNQVPIDVVRAMGADIVIAVDVGTPLAELAPDSSALAIADQTMGLLTVGNTRAQLATLGPRDVLIQPALGREVSTGSFDKTAEALAIGERAATEAAPQLATLAAPGLPRPALPDAALRVDFLVLDNRSGYDDAVFLRHLDGLRGKPLDRDDIERRIRAMYGQYPLELVSYAVQRREGQSGVVVSVEPDGIGRTAGEFGLNFSGNSDGRFLFNFTAGLLQAPLNASGGELRSLLTLGDEPGLVTEWYQPLSAASPYFADMRVGYQKSLTSLVDDSGQVLADYALPRTFLHAKFGRAYGNWGELSVEAIVANGELTRRVGSPLLPDLDFQVRELALNFRIDRVDSLYLPRSGYLLDFSQVSAERAWGNADSYRQVDLDFLYADAIGRHSGFGGLRYHANYDGRSGFPGWHAVGGVTRFAGYQPEQRYAENYGLAYLGYTYELGRLLGRPAVLGGTLETGKIWFGEDLQGSGYTGFAGWQTHASVYFGFDSWLGLLIMGYGRSDAGEGNLFIELGRTR